MSGDIVFGIRLKYDGKEVTGGVDLNRDQFRQLAAEAKKAGDATAGGFTTAAKGVRSISDQLVVAKNAALGYFGVTQALQASRWIVEQASAMQQLDARLKVATTSVKDYQAAQAGVFEVANRWGAAVSETARAFARLNPVVGQMGGSASTTLKMLDGLSASLRLSGATAGETSAVLMQFAQAMGSGRVGGDEFRTMMESAEPLMRAVAGQLGKTTAELRQMAEEGKLTSSVFGNALLPAMDKLKAQAASIPLGVDQAWQVLKNNLSQAFGREFEASATGVAGAIRSVSENAAPAAAAVHALGYALVEAGKGAAVLGAGAAAAWMVKAGQAAATSALAFMTAAAARIAEAEAAATSAAASVTATAAALAEAKVKRAAAAEIALYGAQRAAIERELTAAEVAHAASLTTLATAETRLAVARAEGNVATIAGTGAATAARGAMAALGGPIGLVTFALTAGAAAWMAWGGASEDAMDRAEKELADFAKRQKFGAGTLGDLKAAQEKDQVKRLEAFSTEGSAAEKQYKELVAQMEKRAKLIADMENMAAEAAKPGAPSNERLSSANQWGTLTKDLKWREKLQETHGERLLQIETAYRDKWLEAKSETERRKLELDHKAVLAAELEEQRAERNALPAAKQSAAVAAAQLDADGSRLKAWHEEYRDTVKRALDESRTDYEGYWALVMAGERHLAEEQLRIAEARRAAARKSGNAGEVIKLQGEIDALQARLKTGIAAETGRGLAGDTEKARSAGSNALVDAANADAKALAAAAAWRRENLSLLDQELLAAREKSAADLRERQAQLLKNDALKHAPELLKQYQQAATEQNAQTLAGIEAEIRARREANAEWINGAKAASRDYIESVDDAAGQTRRAWSGTWKRAEDDLTTFFVSGKLNVRGFVEYTINELARIKLAQPLVKNLAGFADGLLDNLFRSGSSSATTGSATTGLPTGTVLPGGVTVSAKGNVFGSPDLHQYANTVVDRPTYFRFAKGGAQGVMGEVPGESEGIFPLKRNKQGQLGVIAEGVGGGLSSIKIEIHHEGANRPEVVSAKPTIDFEGLHLALHMRDARDRGPISQTLETTFGLRR